MLVLSRRFGQRIRLTLPGGEEVWIKTERPRRFGGGGDCRLAIDAPPSVRIDREEVVERGEAAPGGKGK